MILVIINSMGLTQAFFVFSLKSDCSRKKCNLSRKDMGLKLPNKMQCLFVIVAALKGIETTGKRLFTITLGFHKAFMIQSPAL